MVEAVTSAPLVLLHLLGGVLPGLRSVGYDDGTPGTRVGPGRADRAHARIRRTEYVAHRDGARTFSGTRITDPEVVRAQEPWLERWTAAGHALGEAIDAAELVTSFVVGFVIQEHERTQSDLERRDALIGEGAPLVVAAGHARGDDDARFERQLGILLTGLAAGPGH